jgi:hypothetical protein
VGKSDSLRPPLFLFFFLRLRSYVANSSKKKRAMLRASFGSLLCLFFPLCVPTSLRAQKKSNRAQCYSGPATPRRRFGKKTHSLLRRFISFFSLLSCSRCSVVPPTPLVRTRRLWGNRSRPAVALPPTSVGRVSRLSCPKGQKPIFTA